MNVAVSEREQSYFQIHLSKEDAIRALLFVPKSFVEGKGIEKNPFLGDILQRSIASACVVDEMTYTQTLGDTPEVKDRVKNARLMLPLADEKPDDYYHRKIVAREPQDILSGSVFLCELYQQNRLERDKSGEERWGFDAGSFGSLSVSWKPTADRKKIATAKISYQTKNVDLFDGSFGHYEYRWRFSARDNVVCVPEASLVRNDPTFREGVWTTAKTAVEPSADIHEDIFSLISSFPQSVDQVPQNAILLFNNG